MSTARWSLRLPRVYNGLAPRVQPAIGRPRQAVIQRQGQHRGLRSRPWASKPQRREDKQRIPQPGSTGGNGGNDAAPQGTTPSEPQVGRNTQLAVTLAQSDTSDLVSDVHIPDDPHTVLPKSHPALSLLGQSSVVIQRQLEMMNVMLGFEQANRYIMMNGHGQTIGYIAEQDHGIGSTMARQVFRTHRSFTAHIFDAQEREVLRIHRPFAYINSRIRIYDPVPDGGYQNTETSLALQDTSASSVVQRGGSAAQISPLKLDEMRIIGEAQQQWAPLRRKYNLFTLRPLSSAVDTDALRVESGDKPSTDTTALTQAKVPDQAIEAGMVQFAHVDEPFLSWDFNLRNESKALVGSVNRNFAGFAREIFTDTGVYVLRMDSAAQASVLESADGKEVGRYEHEATYMALDQRAVMLATAVSIDFDYFSRHSGASSGGFMPIFWPMGGGAAEGGAAGAGAAGAAAGAAEGGAIAGAGEGAIGAAGRTVGGLGAGESGIAAAGTMAGYEAMQRGARGESHGDADNAPVMGADDGHSPQVQGPSPSNEGPQQQERPWWENDQDDDPWSGGGSGGPPPSAGGEGGGSGEGGGGWADALSDFFGD